MAEGMADLLICCELVDYNRSHASLYIHDIYEVIEAVLRIEPKDVAVIQKSGPSPKRYNVGVWTADAWNRYSLDSFLDKRFELSSGRMVLIQKAYETFDDVTVKNIPPYCTKEQVERIFGFYGLFQSVTRNN